MSRTLRAVIVGGGIGGLTAGVALRQAGVDVRVHERTPELQEIGAGIALASNAMKALASLGLAERVEAAGAPVLGGTIKTRKGGVLTHAAGEAREFLNVCVHRADLQRVLAEALGDEHLHLGHELAGFEQDGETVAVRFANGSGDEGDFLVGADGLRSRVRELLHGEEGPRYAGYTAWRAVAAFDAGAESSESWGDGKRFGIVPIGGGRVYWFATKNAPEGEPEQPEGRKAELLRMFHGWHQPIKAVIEATAADAILRHDIYDRKPLKRPWGKDRVTLLGDAAHPTTPNLGQGACQAMEDAVVLAHHLRTATDAPAALRRYEAARMPRTAYITDLSWRIGKLTQIENALGCWLRDAAVRVVPSSVQRKQLQRVVRFELPDSE